MITIAPDQQLDDAGSYGPVILDGGLSNALEDRGHDLGDAMWTARLLRDDPAEIAAVHRTYFEAGARVATTASYQASLPGWAAAGVSAKEATSLITRSVTIAKDARDAMARDGVARWVAASVGPYGATLADGSEYRGRYGLSPAALRDFHAPRMELLVAADPDFLAVETIPDVEEAEVVVSLLHELAAPAWLSFTVAAGRTRAGQLLAEAFSLAAAATTVFAVGVNCCAPGEALPAIGEATQAGARSIVVYPNSGEDWSPTAHAWQGQGRFDTALAPAWVAAGARYVGGCCRVGPSTIAALAEAVASPYDMVPAATGDGRAAPGPIPR